ncbi:CENP-B N-terminal DNA-binding domain [Popillia japonica]|uniref:CENP-B N-terminal DNA-binding domain n=1 Tax=Popillia japonica TaxID=7064 RepID=A0AAW1I808_POPJA
MAQKRSNKCLSIREKKEIIQAVSDGEKKINVAKRFKIPPSTLTSILHRKDFIAATPSNSVKKRQKAGGFTKLEKALMTWFSQCRQQNVLVSGILMKEKAKIYAEKLGIRDFRASDGWFDRFKKGNNITFRKICGESASVDNNVCIEWKQKLSEIIHHTPMCEYGRRQTKRITDNDIVCTATDEADEVEDDDEGANDVVVAEILTDNDIVCTATDEADEVEDDDEEELPTITFKEARTYIDKVRILLTKASDINDDV